MQATPGTCGGSRYAPPGAPAASWPAGSGQFSDAAACSENAVVLAASGAPRTDREGPGPLWRRGPRLCPTTACAPRARLTAVPLRPGLRWFPVQPACCVAHGHSRVAGCNLGAVFQGVFLGESPEAACWVCSRPDPPWTRAARGRRPLAPLPPLSAGGLWLPGLHARLLGCSCAWGFPSRSEVESRSGPGIRDVRVRVPAACRAFAGCACEDLLSRLTNLLLVPTHQRGRWRRLATMVPVLELATQLLKEFSSNLTSASVLQRNT